MLCCLCYCRLVRLDLPSGSVRWSCSAAQPDPPGFLENLLSCSANKNGNWSCFPGGSEGKTSAYNAGDPGSIPGSGRSAGEGNGNPLQYSCLGKFHRQRNLGGHSPWGCKRVRRDLATKQQQITCLPACLSCANQLIQGLYPQLPSYLTLTHQSNISPTLNHVRSKCQLTGD